MKKIAVKKDQAFTSEGIPLCDNFHFSIMPKEIESEADEWLYRRLGYEIVEVDDIKFDLLVSGFRKMIMFQLEVNMLFNELESQQVRHE